MTPEGKVKTQVRRILQKFGDDIYSFMPVQYGYGATTLDYLCAVQRISADAPMAGHNLPDPIFFAIETKAPGKKPTPRQESLIAFLRRMGAKVFVIDGPKGLKELEDWLIWTRMQVV